MKLNLLEDFNKELLFDGLETDYYNFNQVITIDGNIIFLKTLSFKPFAELKLEVSEDSFNELIRFCNAQEILPHGSYKATEGLFLYYKIENNYLIVISTGEFQPGRFKIYLEGIWKT